MIEAKNIAVILAAGSGSRSQCERPKQIMKLAGKPVVEHTLGVFHASPDIDEILVVTSRDCIEPIEEIVARRRMHKVRRIILGGAERRQSSLAAIEACESDARAHRVRLIFHDAVRPLVSERIIHDVVAALEHYNAVDVVVPAADTVVVADAATNTIQSIPLRSLLRCGQTPQAFSYEVIRDAYRLAMKDAGFQTTDDCGVVLKYRPDEKIFLVAGEQNNMKLTYAEDLHILDKLLQMKSKRLIAADDLQGLARLKGKVIAVVGGTSGIGEEMTRLANAYQAHAIPLGRRNGVDVADLGALQGAFERIAAEHGRIDCVVNAAGTLCKQPLINLSSDEIQAAIQTNYVGVVNVARASFEHLRRSRGQLLNFTSSSYTYGRAFYSLYSSCKAAVVNFTQALAEEWNPEVVRVNCINPERTDTPMRREAFGMEDPQTLLSASDVARQALGVLLMDATGQIFDVRRGA
jgi:2-C-methyl-D-erythritol 4-phosphate cytidylyltransferase